MKKALLLYTFISFISLANMTVYCQENAIAILDTDIEILDKQLKDI